MSSQRRRDRNSPRNTDNMVFEAFDPYAAPMTISVVNDPLEDDAAVARALQAEYEAEYRRSQSAMRSDHSVPLGLIVSTLPYESLRGSQPSSSRPSARDTAFRGESVRRVHDPSSSSARAVERKQQERSQSKSRRSSQELSDAEYAQKLEREMCQAGKESHSSKQAQRHSSKSRSSLQDKSDEEYARRLARELNKPHVLAPATAAETLKRSQTPATSRSNSEDDIAIVEVAIMTADDEAYARRVEQELADERLAETIRRQEQQRMDRQRANTLQQRQQQPTSRKCWFTLFPILLIIGAVGGILYFFVFGDDGLPNWMPSPEEFAEEDPFAQKGPDEVNKWRTSNSGLELEVMNALDDLWFPYFYTAVSEWDEGSPDAVTLRTTRVDADTECRTVPGVLKVCNGNYGETSWRGINKLLLENDDIYASAARMNEFYFRGEDSDQRQYTMCHEIGHGLGLPHTDESFVNRDLGNCMDYTNRPDVNKQPDRSNYVFLAELYGTVPGSPPYTPDVDTDGTVEAEAQVNSDSESDHNSDDRRLRGTSGRILRFIEGVDQEIERGLSAIRSHSDWTLLHSSAYGEAHEKILDGQFKVQVHFLLA